jgi:hypothetical protein
MMTENTGNKIRADKLEEENKNLFLQVDDLQTSLQAALQAASQAATIAAETPSKSEEIESSIIPPMEANPTPSTLEENENLFVLKLVGFLFVRN